ncbi:MAG: TadE/TadG family type IV pilus assembly protein [Sphingomicrobium sp.]
MKLYRPILRNDKGVATIEMAFALPILIVMIWMFVQFAQMYRALAGIQQALGEGARYATLCLTPGTTGCSVPSAASIKSKISASVYGIGPGTFTVADPALVTVTGGSASYYDLTVSYTQPTDMLLLPGPTVNITRSKRVWVAGT